MKRLALLALLSGAWPALGADLAVRVDAAAGAPRLTVNGQPVRARMFFGNPGSSQIDVAPEGGMHRFEFTARADAPINGTMHWRFGDSAGTVELGSVEVTDLTTSQKIIDQPAWNEAAFTRNWLVYPPQNEVAHLTIGSGSDGASNLHVALQAPGTGKWPDFHVYHQPNLPLISDHRYRVDFWAAASPARRITVSFYRPGNPYTFVGGPEAFEEQIKLAAEAGVDFVSFNLLPPWNPPGTTPDWTGIDARCWEVLQANPQALLVPRINLHAPEAWLKLHPAELMVWEPPGQPPCADVASKVFRHDAAEQLRSMVTHLEAVFGNHMAGYHPAGQNTDEWFYEHSWLPPLNGYGETDRAAWREWLAQRYFNDMALRHAWHNEDATLAQAEVPSPQARLASPAGTLRDPQREQALIDFATFQQDLMADTVCELAHVVREATQGRKLVLFFYGYLFEFGSMANGPAASGHYALRRVLDSPDIDLLCAPISYFDRGLGGGAPSMSATESVALAGKMVLREDDTYTSRANGAPPGVDAAARSVQETREELRRNVGSEALRNFATWWMDLGSIGWFDEPRFWDEMRALQRLDQVMLDHPQPYRPEVAAIIDEDVMTLVTPKGTHVTGPGISSVRSALDRLGASYGQYLIDDVSAGRVDAKMLIFLDAWRLDATRRKELLAKTQGRTKVWCYAPGYLDGDQPSLDAMSELTGFRMKRLGGVVARAQPTTVGQALGLEAFGSNSALDPLFAAADATSGETLATYPDGSAAVALRQTDAGPSLFVGPPGLTSGLLRAMAARAGVHLYTHSDCNVTSNGSFLVLHGATSGDLQLDIGSSAAVFDLVSSQKVGAGPLLSLSLRLGETRVLRTGN